MCTAGSGCRRCGACVGRANQHGHLMREAHETSGRTKEKPAAQLVFAHLRSYWSKDSMSAAELTKRACTGPFGSCWSCQTNARVICAVLPSKTCIPCPPRPPSPWQRAPPDDSGSHWPSSDPCPTELRSLSTGRPQTLLQWIHAVTLIHTIHGAHEPKNIRFVCPSYDSWASPSVKKGRRGSAMASASDPLIGKAPAPATRVLIRLCSKGLLSLLQCLLTCCSRMSALHSVVSSLPTPLLIPHAIRFRV